MGLDTYGFVISRSPVQPRRVAPSFLMSYAVSCLFPVLGATRFPNRIPQVSLPHALVFHLPCIQTFYVNRTSEWPTISANSLSGTPCADSIEARVDENRARDASAASLSPAARESHEARCGRSAPSYAGLKQVSLSRCSLQVLNAGVWNGQNPPDPNRAFLEVAPLEGQAPHHAETHGQCNIEQRFERVYLDRGE